MFLTIAEVWLMTASRVAGYDWEYATVEPDRLEFQRIDQLVSLLQLGGRPIEPGYSVLKQHHSRDAEAIGLVAMLESRLERRL